MFNTKLPHILLIEDDEIDQENIKRAFKDEGILNPLSIANDGQEALDMLKGESGYTKLAPTPSIILLDINMPRMNGFEFLEILKKDTVLSLISVYIFTSSDTPRDILRAHQHHVSGYILKPFGANEVVITINTLKQYWSIAQFPKPSSI